MKKHFPEKETPGPATFQRFSERVDTEIPGLEEHVGHLANYPKEDFYPTLKKMAENETGNSWECDFMVDYYR